MTLETAGETWVREGALMEEGLQVRSPRDPCSELFLFEALE